MESTPSPETFGARLTRLRKAKHMTQTELADAVGLSRSMICKLEGGSRGSGAPLSTLRRLADALDTTVAVLAGE